MTYAGQNASELLRLLSPLGDAPAVWEVESEADRADDGACVVCLRGSSPAEWLWDGEWRIYASPVARRVRPGEMEIVSFVSARGERASVGFDAANRVVTVPFSLEDAYRNYVMERWKAEGTRSLSAGQLGLYYRFKRVIPRTVGLALRRRLARWQQQPEFPLWPYDDSVSRLLQLLARCMLIAKGTTELPFRWFWPDGNRAAAILTHDVESAEGLRGSLDIADLEEERGLRSSFNIVADGYPIDHGILKELTARGFELGVHGVRHDASMFSSRAEFERQLPAVERWAETLGASGFRSPATHRVVDWLAELPVDYDCTVPHSDPYEPVPGGCCSPWPYYIGPVLELPYTLPQDHTLFTILREETTDLWQKQVERLEHTFGLIQCVSHPDRGYLADPDNRRRYAEFMDWLLEREALWLALPRTIAAWWRERTISGEFEHPHGTFQLEDDAVSIQAPRELVR